MKLPLAVGLAALLATNAAAAPSDLLGKVAQRECLNTEVVRLEYQRPTFYIPKEYLHGTERGNLTTAFRKVLSERGYTIVSNSDDRTPLDSTPKLEISFDGEGGKRIKSLIIDADGKQHELNPEGWFHVKLKIQTPSGKIGDSQTYKTILESWSSYYLKALPAVDKATLDSWSSYYLEDTPPTVDYNLFENAARRLVIPSCNYLRQHSPKPAGKKQP